jgi:hypothetical protein
MAEDDKKPKHPAHGVVSIHRISGLTNLFQSGFNHHNWIALTISRAKEFEGYGVDSSLMQDEQIIEIYLSEAQFARMITTPNMGGGTPCTINRFFANEELAKYNGSIPDVEKEDVKKTHKDKVKEAINERLGKVNELRKQIADWREAKHRPTLSELDELVSSIDSLHLAANFAWMQRLMEEKMEATVAEGKTEIEAHIAHLAKQVGLDTISQAKLPTMDEPPRIEQKDQS